MDKTNFAHGFLATFSGLTTKQLEQLETYALFLQQENQKYNLTRLDKENDLWQTFFYQTLLCYQLVGKNDFKTVLDIGSGNGCPGIILKIIGPTVHLTLVEANTKKCHFLQELVKRLQGQDVVVVHERAEDYFHHCRQRFDLVTAIAVANLEIICELAIPFACVNGLIILPKSRHYLNETKDLPKMLDSLSCRLRNVLSFDVQGKINNVLYLEKIAPTKKCFPRAYKLIVKGFDYDK